MNSHRSRTIAAGAALAIACALTPADATAQAADHWQFTGSLNLYLPTIHGSSIFPASGGGSPASVEMGSVLDHLQSTFMGSLEARKGQWGLFTDLLYLDLSTDRSGSRAISVGPAALPVGAAADVEFGLRGTVWTLGGSYRLPQAGAMPVDVIAGARMLDLRTSLDWTLSGNVGAIASGDRTGSRSSRMRNWDAIVGVKGRYPLGAGGTWFVPYYLDVGTGESRLTFQAIGGLGYAFSWGDIAGTWRYLSYDFKDGGAIKDLRASGPMVSAIFHW